MRSALYSIVECGAILAAFTAARSSCQNNEEAHELVAAAFGLSDSTVRRRVREARAGLSDQDASNLAAGFTRLHQALGSS